MQWNWLVISCLAIIVYGCRFMAHEGYLNTSSKAIYVKEYKRNLILTIGTIEDCGLKTSGERALRPESENNYGDTFVVLYNLIQYTSYKYIHNTLIR